MLRAMEVDAAMWWASIIDTAAGGEISQCSPGVYPGNLQLQKSHRLSSLPYNSDIPYPPDT